MTESPIALAGGACASPSLDRACLAQVFATVLGGLK
jgi:hypothetical protein